ncbi:MAG: arylsulfotransferase family protein [Candidatus Altiarchaeota archaeon]
MKSILLTVLTMLVAMAAVRTMTGTVKEGIGDSVESIGERLESIGYVPYVVDDENPDMEGVTVYDRGLAYQGLNLYTPARLGRSYLMDMEGNKMHEWKAPKGFPGKWEFANTVDNNSLIIVIRDHLSKMWWNSSVEWTSKGKYHHDFDVSEEGDIYALSKGIRRYEGVGRILDNHIVVLTPEGRVKKRISVFKLLGEEYVKRVMKLNETRDVFHANTIDLIEDDVGIGVEGDVLLCFRNINLVAIADLEDERIVWSWGEDELRWPHHPTILENGNIQVFDNRAGSGSSRVVEYDPIGGEIVWEYEGDPPKSFYTSTRGGSQRLPNGNILITETNRGRVFEVTGDGRIVWEYWIPERYDGKRAVVYRMIRLGSGSFKEI